MISLEQLQANFEQAEARQDEYCCQVNLNIYDSPSYQNLGTQAAVGRHLQFLSKTPVDKFLEVRLSEDSYCGWLPVEDLAELEYAVTRYQPITVSTTQIQERLPAVIAFTKAAMQEPNHYVWGGTVAPNYDCSGLMQAAFVASGIWLPRNSYMQDSFTTTIEMDSALPGDLIFFATNQKVHHVGLYLGDGYYIHSSGTDTGRNGIAIDRLSDEGDEIAKSYYRILKGAGRVEKSYQP
ncbi:MAG: C40 family peptidase [Symploca sp. SIO2C1]|nr:C40 family peptidase [Symploca sp. SIO2C1]